MASTHTYTKREEIANAITHGIGALLSIAALILLIVLASMEGTVLHILSFTIYGVTMLMLYVSSTLVHSLPEGRAKDICEIMDHSAIYIYIAGTYTPITLHIVQGTTGWVLFGIVWGLALAGVLFKVFYTKKFRITSTILYIAMGWIIVVAWKSLLLNFNNVGLFLLITGGVCYTVGTLFYVWRGFLFHHAVWHLFVLAGSAFIFFSILLNALP